MGGHRDAIDDVVSAAQVEAVIQAAIQALPERRRIALTLRLVNHMTFSEIGEAMQISDKAAFILVSRARDTLMPLVSLLK
jgi:DNA-directed RNA polymerase specialized sigma24 family protein